ncbi:MAG TPA: GNAT family N-acetyltransferase [Mycobacteriales bacterium]|nr:GNAT family N-acetyltransferase [Mycobacteriales bacterium]
MAEGILRTAAPPVDEAAAVAARVADRAGVEIRHLHDLQPMQEVADLFVEVWQTRAMEPPINRDLLRALAHAGGYVAAAYADEALVGGSVGFLAADGSLHSHISGVRSGLQGRSVGHALKLDQRAWCLERGIATVTWTFDPLVRRNAWFNLCKLGATGEEYLREFYGPMQDALNAGDSSDRLFARWDLLSPRVAEIAAGAAPDTDADRLRAAGARVLVEDGDGTPIVRTTSTDGSATLLVATPEDAVRLRGDEPQLASRWRHAVRDAMEPAVGDGYSVTGMTRSGYYVLTTKDGSNP